MSEQTQYAWAAGFFDGEGCVSLSHQGRWTCARIILVQKDPRPLEHFKLAFDLDEKISPQHRRHGKKMCTYLRLVVSGRRAADVLTKMLPYLTLKRAVAEVAIDLQSRVNSQGGYTRWRKMSDDELAVRRGLVEKAKWLNSGRWAAATTKPTDPVQPGCDSLNCTDSKGAEVAETTTRLPN
jgi:hypothetical protein